MNSRRYSCIVLLLAPGLYLLLRLLLAVYCSLALSLQDVRDKNRLANIHLLPQDAAMTVIETFCTKMPDGGNNVLLLGDSQAYGHGRPTALSYASILNKSPEVNESGFNVFNLAIINGTFRDSMHEINVLQRCGRKVTTFILGANPTHFIKHPKTTEKDEYCIHPSVTQRSVLRSLLLTHVNVFDVTGFSWRNTRKLHPVDLFGDNNRPREDFDLLNVGNTYCANLDSQSSLPDLVALIQLAKKNAERVVFYTQPRAYGDYLSPPYNYDWRPEEVDKVVLSKARELGCNVVLDLADAFPRDHFRDLIHLNQRGHEALAKTLLPHIIGGSKP